MNVEKLKKPKAEVRIGGKGTARRKKKVVHSDQCNSVKDDCSYSFLSIADSNPVLEQFLDDWKDELYRKSTILRLNDDCFYHIFKFLPVIDLCALRHTCSRFRIISDYCFEKQSKSFCLERNYVYGSLKSGMWLNDAKRLIQNYGQCITKLSVQRTNFDPCENASRLLPLLDRYCFQLKDLALVQTYLEPVTIRQCIQLLSNLDRLVIDGWIHEELIDYCLAHCGSLKRLKFTNLNEIKGEFLKKRFEFLESFTMINCTLLNGNVRNFLAKNGQLKKIKLTQCRFTTTSVRSDAGVISLPNLESLTLISTNFMRLLRPMARFPTTLQRLEVDFMNLQQTVHNNIEDLHIYCDRLTKKLDVRLSEIKTLKILKLEGADSLDARFYQNVASKLHALSELHFIHCSTKFIDIKEFVQHSINLKKIVFLQKLKNDSQQLLTVKILLSLVRARLQNEGNKETLLLFLNEKEVVDIYHDFEKNGASNLFVKHAEVIKLLPWTNIRIN